MAIGGHFWIPGERLRPATVAGLACAFVGVARAFADAVRLPSRREVLGDTMELVAAVLWGATTLVIKTTPHRIGAAKTLFYQLAGSAVVLLPLSFALGEPGITRTTPLVIGSILYQTVVVAFASYLVWFWLLARYPASQLAAFSFLTPLFGGAAGGLLLGEPITPGLASAMLLVALGIYLVNRRPRATVPRRT